MIILIVALKMVFVVLLYFSAKSQCRLAYKDITYSQLIKKEKFYKCHIPCSPLLPLTPEDPLLPFSPTSPSFLVPSKALLGPGGPESPVSPVKFLN